MADLKRVFWGGWCAINNAPGFTTAILNQSTDAAEWVFQAAASDTITALWIRQSSITTAGSMPSFTVALKDVDASGNPGSTTYASGTYTPISGNNNKLVKITLSASYAVTKGSYYSITFSSASASGTENVTVAIAINSASIAENFPYAIANDNGSRTRQNQLPCFAYASATAVYGYPAETLPTWAFNSASSSFDEVGVKFTIPAGAGDTFTISGVRAIISCSSGKSIVATLYDTNGTSVLQDVTHDSDLLQAAATGRLVELLFDEATLSTLTCGSTYRISIKITDATGTLTLAGVQGSAAADLEAFNGGQNFTVCTRVDAGSWDDTTYAAARLGLELIVQDLTEPSGGSGGAVRLVNGGLVGT